MKKPSHYVECEGFNRDKKHKSYGKYSSNIMLMNIKPIFLPIFHHTDETLNAHSASVEAPLTECETRQIKFYQICAITLYEEGDKKYTKIFIPGTSFVCSLPPEEVDKKIISLSVCTK